MGLKNHPKWCRISSISMRILAILWQSQMVKSVTYHPQIYQKLVVPKPRKWNWTAHNGDFIWDITDKNWCNKIVWYAGKGRWSSMAKGMMTNQLDGMGFRILGQTQKSFTHGDVVFTHMKGFVIFPQSETIILKWWCPSLHSKPGSLSSTLLSFYPDWECHFERDAGDAPHPLFIVSIPVSDGAPSYKLVYIPL